MNTEDKSANTSWLLKLLTIGAGVGLLFAIVAASFMFPFGLLGLFGLLDSMAAWFYADLYRSCSGMFCVSVTGFGYLVAIFFYVLAGLVAAMMVYLANRVLGRKSILSYFLVPVLTIIIFYLMATMLGNAQHYLPKTPLAFRCRAVINHEAASLNIDEQVYGSQMACVYEIASTRKDLASCDLINNELFKSYCAGHVAHAMGDIKVCDKLDEQSRPYCVETMLLIAEESTASQTTVNIDQADYSYNNLNGQAHGEDSNTYYYKNGDIESVPTLLWSKGHAVSGVSKQTVDPLVVEGGVVNAMAQGFDHNAITWAMWNNKTGEHVWHLNTQQYITVDTTPVIKNGIFYFTDDYLRAVKMENQELLWKTPAKDVNAPLLVDDQMAYLLISTNGTTGYPLTIKAFHLNNGNQAWAQPIGVDSYVVRALSQSNRSIFAMTKSNYSNEALLSIFDKQTGELRHTVTLPGYGENEASVLGVPVFSQNNLWVRVANNIIKIDEQSGKITKIYTEESNGRSAFVSVSASKITLNNDRLYFVNSANQVVGKNLSNDQTLWRTTLTDKITSSPIISENYLYVATEKHIVAIKRLTGEVAWRYSLLDSVGSGLVVSDQKLHFVSKGGRLYVLGN